VRLILCLGGVCQGDALGKAIPLAIDHVAGMGELTLASLANICLDFRATPVALISLTGITVAHGSGITFRITAS
jgi:hypothetical protein